MHAVKGSTVYSIVSTSPFRVKTINIKTLRRPDIVLVFTKRRYYNTRWSDFTFIFYVV
jgi:hypothetical protein